LNNVLAYKDSPTFIFCFDYYFLNVSEWLKDKQIDGKILVFRGCPVIQNPNKKEIDWSFKSKKKQEILC